MAAAKSIGGRRLWGTKIAVAAGLLILLCGTVLGLAIYRELEIRDSEIHAAEIEASNLARSLLQHVEDSFELADTALIGIAHRLETEGFHSEAISRLQSFLNLRKSTLPRIRGLFVYGADGSWIATSENIDLRIYNNADRDYFRHHQTATDRRPFIGSPIRSRSGGQWILTVSRRVNGPAGEFAGVVLATLDVDYFVRNFSRYGVGSDGSLALLSSTGTLFARHPFNDAAIGRDFSWASFVSGVSKGSAGVAHFRSMLDGVDRIGAYHLSERFPVLMLVARGKDEALATWRHESRWRMATVAVLTLLIASLGAIMLKELAFRNRLLRVISSREADFRLLAESSSDMVTRIAFDGQLTYVSPSSLRVLGWAPDQLVGTQSLAGIHDDDRATVEAVVAEMRRGDRMEALISYRTRHRTSGMVWLESSLSVTQDPETGRIDGVVAVSRDVSEHKQLEGYLSRLATLDSLTGLANRRFLDTRAERELALARQSGGALALLLLDADHFKAFNDTYGHQAGDHCLQQIAAVIQSHATRPGDLAARYGGEEFALLLPDTDAEGARIVGERIRKSIQNLAVRHSQNSPYGVVTVSVGGSCLNPAVETGGMRDLIHEADCNLYFAKGSGRNRVAVGTAVHTSENLSIQSGMEVGCATAAS